MSDLISRQAVLDILEKEKSLRCGYDADIAIFSIEKGVRELSTAYDVSRVVAELEKEKCTRVTYKDNYKQGWNNGIANAIDIVRRGGVE